ncbi:MULTISPECIES: hypothetical protein [unclassified Streptomyces]|uniref:hypothetical protein n=1 Tax=unclassified Streptomyces TaxID=2593676 RepID=UPI0035DEA9E6
MNDVHELLERAVESAGRSAGSTEAVYARAARVRTGRRAAVAAAALAVVVAGALSLTGAADGPRTEHTAVAAAPDGGTGAGGKAGRLAALLPPGVGGIEQVSLAVLLKGATEEQARTTYVGPLDGEYLVREGDGAGYLLLRFMERADVVKKLGGRTGRSDLCATRGTEPSVSDCVREELPDGSVLTTWSDSMEHGDGGTPRWGRETAGRLVLKDGSVLAARSSSGYLGDRSQGPLLAEPPLGGKELRALLVRPELLPKG